MAEYLLDIHDDKGFKLSFPYSLEAVKEIKKASLGFKWNPGIKAWYCLGPEAVLDLERSRISVTATAAAEARYIEFRNSLNQILEVKMQSAPEGLYGFQQIGSRVLALQRRGILADEMGLGKSKQTLDAARKLLDAQSLIILCPKSLVYNWVDEVEKWYPDMDVMVLPDNKKERAEFWKSPSTVTIANYEKSILADWPKEMGWDVAIFDEVQRAKNSRTQLNKALRSISKQAGAVFALSGTPLEIRVEELYGVMSVIRPAVFGDFYRFRDQHLLTDYFGRIVGSRNNLLLKERIGPWITRRTKAEVLTQLPPKVYNTAWVDLSPWEAAEYQRMREHFLDWLTEQEREMSEANALTQLLRLQQFTSSPALLYDPQGGAEANNITGAKLDELRIIISEWDGRVVIFTRFVDMARILVDELQAERESLIMGDVPAKERTDRVRAFNNGELGKILISTDAGAYGLNITGADLIVHYDLLWNPARMWQREDRLHRIGQTSVVNVLTMVARGTIDQGMLGVLEKRRELFHDIIDGAEEVALVRLGAAQLRKITEGGY